MLVNFQHLFNATVQEDCTHQRLKDIAKNFGRLKQFDLSPIDQEVAAERIPDKLIRLLLVHKFLLLLINLPLHKDPHVSALLFLGRNLSKLLIAQQFRSAKQYEPMKA